MELKFKQIKEVGTISKDEKDWSKKLVYGSWNDREPKYELRTFAPDGTARKGIGLTLKEIHELKKILNEEF